MGGRESGSRDICQILASCPSNTHHQFIGTSDSREITSTTQHSSSKTPGPPKAYFPYVSWSIVVPAEAPGSTASALECRLWSEVAQPRGHQLCLTLAMPPQPVTAPVCASVNRLCTVTLGSFLRTRKDTTGSLPSTDLLSKSSIASASEGGGDSMVTTGSASNGREDEGRLWGSLGQ